MNTYDNEFWKLADRLVSENGIRIDRPKGTRHPRYPEYVYPLDYGYVSNTASQDGAGIDVWVGTAESKRVSAIIGSIDMVKRDSEIKILYACMPDEIRLIYDMHNRTDGMKGVLFVRDPD